MKFIASSICQGKRLDTVYHLLNLAFSKYHTTSTLPDKAIDDKFHIATPPNVPLELQGRWEHVAKLAFKLFDDLREAECEIAPCLIAPFSAEYLYTTAGNIDILGYTLPTPVERDYHLPLLTDAEIMAFEETRDFKTYGHLSACRIKTANNSLTMQQAAKIILFPKHSANYHPALFVDGDWKFLGELYNEN
jgi:hypothetical protein|nr:MAG TPA: hypothetical protein [Caudoviricetes sp.]